MTKKIHKYSGKKLSRGEPPNFSGQHLLHNKRLLYEMADRARIGGEDTVLELGAGKGALTAVLNSRAKKVLAVEYDAEFVEILKRKTAGQANTVILYQDIMKIRLPKEKFVVVSNIPYSITTPIMKLLLNNPASGFQRGVIVMEKGAAQRFTSKFIKNFYVLVWRMWFDLRLVKSISRNYFFPPPSVDSAMVTVTRKKEAAIPYKERLAFLGLAEYALRKPHASVELALRGIFTPPQMKRLRNRLNIGGEQPVGTLDEGQWGIIYQTMARYVPDHKRPRATQNLRGAFHDQKPNGKTRGTRRPF